jgi:hypothetical protein
MSGLEAVSKCRLGIVIDDRPSRGGWLIHCRDAVPIPNADRATIAAEKLTAYLLNSSHKRGGAKARLLLSLGYRTDAPEALESDLRTQHLPLNPARTSENAYGVAYEIEGPIRTPSRRIVRFVSIWQIDTGSDVRRFITMYPR